MFGTNMMNPSLSFATAHLKVAGMQAWLDLTWCIELFLMKQCPYSLLMSDKWLSFQYRISKICIPRNSEIRRGTWVEEHGWKNTTRYGYTVTPHWMKLEWQSLCGWSFVDLIDVAMRRSCTAIAGGTEEGAWQQLFFVASWQNTTKKFAKHYVLQPFSWQNDIGNRKNFDARLTTRNVFKHTLPFLQLATLVQGRNTCKIKKREITS